VYIALRDGEVGVAQGRTPGPMSPKMPLRAALGVAAAFTFLAAPVQASVPHTVQPGETLWSIAAANNLTTRTVAAVNGVSADAHVVVGSTIQVPSVSEGAVALGGAPMGGTSSAPATSPAPATGGAVGASGVGSIASQHGVPPSLAAAIAHQESGFNNSVVSPAGARGVMQVMPGTFDYVDRVLGEGPHDPSSPQQNTTAGVVYLRQLLRETGGDQSAAVASYYQGPASVRQNGLLPGTQQYVANVMALKARYGG
jgi:N-acetylmuramoyl-L-alanine amidase